MSDDENKPDDAGEDGADEGKKKGLGLIPMIAGAVVAAGVAGGAAFVLAPSPGGDAVAETHAEGEGAEGEKGTDDSKEKADSGDKSGKKKAAKKKDDKKKDKKKKGSKGGKGGDGAVKPVGTVQHSEYGTFLVLDPIVVSIQPKKGAKHLKVTLVLETTEDGANTLLERGFYIKDVLNTYLRSVEVSVLEDPAAMSRLRAQIHRRINAIAPDVEVENVLVTEFIIT